MIRLGLFTVIAMYVPFVLACAAGLAYVAYLLTAMLFSHWEYGGRLGAALVFSFDLAALMLILLLLLGLLPLFFRRDAEAVWGLTLDPQQHLRLFRLLERICTRLQCRPPDRVVLHPTEETWIGDVDLRDDNGAVQRAQRVLILGAGLIVHLRADEFTTVLCHEIAHAATGDTAFGRFSERFYRSQMTALGATDYDNESPLIQRLVHWLLIGYFLLFLLAYASDSRRREWRADRMAAEICGPQNVRHTLIKTHLAGYVPELTMQSMYMEFAQKSSEMENIYSEYRRRWKELPERMRTDAENRMFLEQPQRLSTHPVLAQRIKALNDVEAKELNLAQPATALFGEWESLEARMTQTLLPMLRAAYEEHLKQMDRQLRRGR